MTKRWKPGKQKTAKITIPFEKTVYPQKLVGNRVYQIGIAKDLPHTAKRLAMFYTGIVVED